MNVILNLHHHAMSDEDIQELTFELKNTLNQETDLTAQLPEERGGLGTRGDAVTIGQILLAGISSGGAIAALLPVLQTYFQRKPSIKVAIETSNGNKTTIEAEHMRPEQIQQTIQDVKQLCESSHDKDNGGND
ncbi:hypothetical protein VU04_05855 [Desulfobulbus sp. TB]|nr:hypothetical protein [Desulfobulbus sp. TB]